MNEHKKENSFVWLAVADVVIVVAVVLVTAVVTTKTSFTIIVIPFCQIFFFVFFVSACVRARACAFVLYIMQLL